MHRSSRVRRRIVDVRRRIGASAFRSAARRRWFDDSGRRIWDVERWFVSREASVAAVGRRSAARRRRAFARRRCGSARERRSGDEDRRWSAEDHREFDEDDRASDEDARSTRSQPLSASAPPMISISSLVIAA
jgi:hypothetical protein